MDQKPCRAASRRGSSSRSRKKRMSRWKRSPYEYPARPRMLANRISGISMGDSMRIGSSSSRYLQGSAAMKRTAASAKEATCSRVTPSPESDPGTGDLKNRVLGSDMSPPPAIGGSSPGRHVTKDRELTEDRGAS